MIKYDFNSNKVVSNICKLAGLYTGYKIVSNYIDQYNYQKESRKKLIDQANNTLEETSKKWENSFIDLINEQREKQKTEKEKLQRYKSNFEKKHPDAFKEARAAVIGSGTDISNVKYQAIVFLTDILLTLEDVTDSACYLALSNQFESAIERFKPLTTDVHLLQAFMDEQKMYEHIIKKYNLDKH